MSRFAYLLRIEIMAILRDKRSLLLAMVIPLIISPLLTYGSLKTLKDGVMAQGTVPVSVKGDPAITGAVKKMFAGMQLAVVEDTAGGGAPAATVLLERVPDVAVPHYKVTISYDSTKKPSVTAVGRVTQALEALGTAMTVDQLTANKLPKEIAAPFLIDPKDQGNKNSIPAWMMGLSVIMAMGMWPMVATMTAAIDLGAGERERKSLEPILSTPISLWTLVLAKFGAVLFSGLLGGIAGSGSALAVYLFYGKELAAKYLPVDRLLLLMPAAICMTILASAAGLFLSLLAKSMKEAGLYVAPLQFVFLLAMMLSDHIDVTHLPELAYAVPMLNCVMLIRRVVLAQPLGMSYVITLASTAVFVLFFLVLGMRTLRSERILE